MARDGTAGRAMTDAATASPVTIGELRHAGRRLHAHCMECGHERPLDLTRVALPAHLHAANAGSRLKCSACGSTHIYTAPEAPQGE